MNIIITSAISIPESEISFQFTRSSGSGGQNVNKVATRVELLFNIKNSPSLTSEEKERVMVAYASRIDGEGYLRVVSQESRSQWKNRELAVRKFAAALRKALVKRKKRVATRPSGASKEARVHRKKKHSVKKALRKRIPPSDE